MEIVHVLIQEIVRLVVTVITISLKMSAGAFQMITIVNGVALPMIKAIARSTFVLRVLKKHVRSLVSSVNGMRTKVAEVRVLA
jgi:hypothetical protein